MTVGRKMRLGFDTANPSWRLLSAACLLLASAVFASASAAPSINDAAPALVLNYWATWCAPCRREMPILDAFYRRYHAQGLEMIGISADLPQDFAKMRTMSDALAYPTSTLDRISENGFGQPEGFPLTYVIDRDGVVRDKFIEVREQLLRDVVLPLLQR